MLIHSNSNFFVYLRVTALIFLKYQNFIQFLRNAIEPRNVHGIAAVAARRPYNGPTRVVDAIPIAAIATTGISS